MNFEMENVVVNPKMKFENILEKQFSIFNNFQFIEWFNRFKFEL